MVVAVVVGGSGGRGESNDESEGNTGVGVESDCGTKVIKVWANNLRGQEEVVTQQLLLV